MKGSSAPGCLAYDLPTVPVQLCTVAALSLELLMSTLKKDQEFERRHDKGG